MLDKFWGRGRIFNSCQALTYFLICCFHMGINPRKKYKILYYIYAICTNISGLIISLLAFNLGYILDWKKLSTSQVLNSVQASFNVFGTLIKFVTIALYLKRLRSAEVIMTALDKRCILATELDKLRNVSMMGNRIIVYYIMPYGFLVLLCFICGLVLAQPPFSLYSPFWDWRNSFGEFATQIFFEFYLVFFITYTQVVNDSYGVIYIFIVRSHMQLLVERVHRLGAQPDMNKDDAHEELVHCIEDHQNVIELLEIIRPVVSTTIFVQFMITAAILCTIMVNIFLVADTSTQIAAFAHLLAVLVQSAPCCYQATYLIADNEQLPLAIFHSIWLDQSVRYRKMLIFFMRRAQRPMTLSAMKLFSINLNTFLSIARFSFSLYTVFKRIGFSQNSEN